MYFLYRKLIILSVIIVIGVLIFVLSVYSKEGYRYAIIDTNKGEIKVKLAVEDAPKTAANFMKLARGSFYDDIIFHRVEKDFVIQGGDPRGDGTGGSEESILLEIKCKDGRMIEGKVVPSDCKPLLQHTKGALSMARTSDPNSASSQFFITLSNTHFLDGQYAVFGYVVSGMEVVESIKPGDFMKAVSILD